MKDRRQKGEKADVKLKTSPKFGNIFCIAIAEKQ
jgi:hypothetical protein